MVATCAACSLLLGDPGLEGHACGAGLQCLPGYACRDGVCVRQDGTGGGGGAGQDAGGGGGIGSDGGSGGGGGGSDGGPVVCLLDAGADCEGWGFCGGAYAAFACAADAGALGECLPALVSPSCGPAFYVSSDGGKDNAAGSAGAPWQTLTRALLAPVPGSRIYLDDGLYQAPIGAIDLKPDASITIAARPGAAPRIRGHFLFSEASNIRLKGLRFDLPTTTPETPLIWIRFSSNIEVSGTTIADAGVYGIGVDFSDGVFLIGNRIEGNGRTDPLQSAGVRAKGSSRVLIANNVFHANELASGVDGGPIGSALLVFPAAKDTTIVSNTFVGHTSFGVQVGSPNELPATERTVLANNIFVQNGTAIWGGGIGEKSTIIARNLFHQNGTDVENLDGGADVVPGDPGFADAGGGDFRPSASGPAAEQAIPALSLPFDVRELPRGARPDLGAYEVTP